MASGATSIYLIPYPLSTDPVNVHGDIKALSDRLEIVLGSKVDKDISNILTKTNTYTITGTDNGIIINQAGTGVPLRITNTGTGNSFLVEDSASTDSTPFVIDASGNVGILKAVPTVPLDVVGAGAFTGALTASTFNALSLTSNATGFAISGGTTAVAVTFAGGSAYSLSGTNGTTITLPATTGTLPLNNQQFYIGTTATAINRASAAQTLTGLTLTTPIIDTINISALGTSGSLWDTTITTGSISTGGSLTTGGVNIATGAAFNGTVAIATGAGTVNKTINIGTASTSGTTAVTIGSSSGATSTVTLNGAVTTSGALTVGGNLTVNGTTTTINSTVVNVDDILIELGAVNTPTDTTAEGGGLALLGATNKTITWSATGTNWTSSENWNILTGKVYKVNNVEVLSSTKVLGITPTINATGFSLAGGTTSKSLTIQNNITLSGTDGVAINLGATNGTLGSAAFTASSAYEPAITTLAISKGGTGTGTAPTQYGLIYATSTTAYASTAAGTNTQVLIGNASGAPTWTNISGLSVSSATTATNLSGTTVYSLPYQSASATTSYVAIGSAGQMLAVNGTANGYVWTSPFTNPMTTLGDMVSGGASGAPARLVGPATNGTYGLTSVTTASAATAPVWTLATGTGSPVYATTPTITTPKIDSISTTTGAAATPSLWSDVTTGTIAIGAGITSGTVNIATAGTGTNSINIGNTNSTLTVNGNLTVNGTTTTVNSVTINVDDPNIELNSIASPTDANANGGGITLKGTTDKTIVWNNANSNWTANQDFNIPTGKVYKVNNFEVLSTYSVLGITPYALATGFTIAGGTTSKTLTVSNTLTLAGTDSSTLDIGSGGTLGTGAFATIANYAPLAGATFTGQIKSTLANSTTLGGGQIYLNGATGNRIDFNQNGVAAPSFSTRSAGTKITLWPNVGASNADYAIGIDSSALWNSVDTTSAFFKWYGGTTLAATLTGTGNLTTVGSVTASSIIKSGGTSSQFLMADGSTVTSVTAAAGTLTGSTLASNVTASSLTSLGILTSLNVSGTSTFNNLSIPGTATFSSTVTVPNPTNTTDAANKAYVDSVLNAGVPEIVPLDDIRGEFNDITSRFVPKYQGIAQSITNPLRLLLSINGIIQYVDFPDYVWQSPLPREGFQIDNEGYIAFSEVVPAGSSFDARIMPGPNTITKTRQYPFKAVDILLGG